MTELDEDILRVDKEKWERRYSEGKGVGAGCTSTGAPDPFLVECRRYLVGGRCLDVACGRGSNAFFAARAGYAVDAFDISLEAARSLRSSAVAERLPIRVLVADIDDFVLPTELYDLILIFNFFSKTSASALSNALKKGGTLISSTYNFRHGSVQPTFNQAYLVPEGGLSPVFPCLERLLDQPEYGRNRNLSRLVARRPQ